MLHLQAIEERAEKPIFHGSQSRDQEWRLGGQQIDGLETLDRWYGPDYRYIKARGTDGGLYILRLDEPQAEWELTMFKSARAQVPMP